MMTSILSVVNTRNVPYTGQRACQSPWTTRAHAGGDGLMRAVNHACGVGATWLKPGARRVMGGAFFSVLLAISTTFSDASAQSPLPDAPASAADAAPSVRPPAPDEAMRAFGLVESWVRSGTTPDEGQDAPPCIASVTLRIDAQIVGRGTDAGGDRDALLRATRAAMAEASAFLNLPNDALAEERRREAFARARIEIELGGSLIPFSPLSFAEVDQTLRPGLDGVAARFGDRVACVFPSAMLVANDTPAQALAAAISRASGDATLAMPMTREGQPGVIASRHGAAYYRFISVHLAQEAPGAPARFLFRAGGITDGATFDSDSIATMGEIIAHHLGRLAPVTGGPGVDGVYWPLLGKSDPDETTPLDLALAAIALKEFSGTVQSIPGRADAAMDASATALRLMQRLSQMGDAAMRDPGTAAATRVALVMVLRDIYADDSELGSLTDRALKATADIYTMDKGFSPACTERCKPLVVYMMTALSEPGSHQRGLAEDALRRLYRETKPEMLVAHMPWLGRAEIIAAAEQVPAAAALREMREATWRHQLTHDDAGPDAPDLVGGIVFTSSRVLLPTWQTARPLSFLATMIRDPRLTDEKDRAGELARALASLRFVRQLCVDDDAATLVLDPSVALGGVRASPWDQRLAPEAAALALISTSETLRTLRWMSLNTPDAR